MLNLSVKYFINIKPFFLKNYKKLINSYQLYCRFFFFLLLFFEYYFNSINFKSNIWVFKVKKKINSFLKAPHHYKIAQTKLQLPLYLIKINFIFYYHFNIKYIFRYMNFYSIFFFFNSNILNLYKKSFTFNENNNNFFYL